MDQACTAFRTYTPCVSILMVLLSGCSRGTPAVSAPEPTAVERLQVAHPEYANWSQFPVGTEVLRRDDLASEQADRFLFTRLRLVEKSLQGIVLETQTTMQRGGDRQVSDITAVDFPAQFGLPPGMTAEQFQAPVLDAVRLEDETITLAGQQFVTEVFTFTDRSEAGPVDVKLWRSNAIPGRQARKQIVDRQGIILSSSETIAITGTAAADNPPR